MHRETARPDPLLTKRILATKFSQSEWDVRRFDPLAEMLALYMRYAAWRV